MQKFIKNNLFFFAPLLIFCILGAILLSQINTGDLLLFFSRNRSYFGDLFFKYFTKMAEEWIYILSILALLFVRFRYAALILITGITVSAVSHSSKAFFKHDRPRTHYTKLKMLDDIPKVEGVKLHVGPSSFPSGHTMSAFAIFSLFAFLYPEKRRFALLMFAFAFLTGLSRVYLVQHFFKDIYLGAIIGTIISCLIFLIQNQVPIDRNQLFDKSLANFFFQSKQGV